MVARTALIFAALATVSLAAVRAGKAEADWLAATKFYTAGKPVQTAIRLVLDQGWHTYWQNPGEGGMKISAVWELPAGWTAGELEHPVPKRFMTGELPGFGYEGTVVLPVKFTPPAGFTGTAKLKGNVSWLTCNDQSCIPGKAALELLLVAGQPVATAEAELIAEASRKIPVPQDAWLHLGVTEKSGILSLRIEAHVTRPLDLNDYEIFPATPQVVDPAAPIQFTRSGAEWRADVAKSEYATKPIQKLTLVLAGKAKQPPLALTWTAEPPKTR